MSSASAAVRYIKHGYAPIPIPARSKGPNLKDWQHLRLEPEDVPKYFNNGRNIGLLLGEPSGGLIDIDLDAPEAVAAGRYLLPDTLRSGRESSPNSHYWYRCEPASLPGTAKFQVPRGGTGEGAEMFAELRSTGKQTVVAPSVHPDGDKYTWGSGEPAEISGPELLERVREVATAALLARHWPMRGRHEIALASAGYLGRRLAPERLHAIIEAAAGAAGDEEWRDRSRAVQDTLEGLKAGRQVTGGPALDQLAPGVPEILTKWWGWQRETIGQAMRVGSSQSSNQGSNLTDLGNAERFVDMHGNRVRWAPALKSWLFYDGRRWARDEGGAVVKLAHLTARSIYKDAATEEDLAKQKAIAKFAVASQNEGRINGMLSQAKPYLVARMDELDQDPWDLNCKSGTLNLRTGELRPHDPADLITKLAPVAYDPSAECPKFQQFLKETLVDEGVIQFMKRYAGYTLTGITRERVLAMLWGGGKNGKTTLVELLRDVMGDYAQNTDVETILAKKYAGVGNDVAALRGARLVSCAEVENGRRLAESKVKQLTGSDTVTARFLFGEPFDFRPQFKLCLSTNNKPVILGVDDAIWDRIRLVPFSQRFEGSAADPNLPEKLRGELPGILAWMVDGCREWQEHGLGEPESVKDATNQYREEMDTLAAFLEDRCVVAPGVSVLAGSLYQKYSMWCDANGERQDPQKRFASLLSARGFSRERGTRGVAKGRQVWLGIGLREDEDRPDPDDFGEKIPPPPPPPPFSPPRESPIPTPNSTPTEGRGGESGGENHKVSSEKPRVSNAFGTASTFATATVFATDDVRKLFESPPGWLRTQARICREAGAPERLIKALAVAVASHLYEDHERAGDVTAAVEAQFHRPGHPIGCECEVCHS
jgi:putative DNA primase/helicase